MSRYLIYFDGFIGHYLLFALMYLLAMYEVPPLNPFSMNQYMSMSNIFLNSSPVIFNIASQLNPGELK